MFDGLASEGDVSAAISELEKVVQEGAGETAAALLVLKNELAGRATGGPERDVLYEGRFSLPGSLPRRLRERFRRVRGDGVGSAVAELAADVGAWLGGRDAARFRDRCDRVFYRRVFPAIEASFGELAERLANTVNEAVINYAEHGFRRWALLRQVHLHLILTEGDLAYAIVRPSGWRLRRFDPFDLRRREARGKLERRGWGHTLIYERALFLSFDREPRRRGMLIVIGPEEEGFEQAGVGRQPG